MKSPKPALFILTSLLLVGLLVPGASVGIGLWFLESPYIVGPFILLSPILALCIVIGIAMSKSDRERNLSVTHPGLEAEVSAISAELGLIERRVFAQPEDEEERRWPLTIFGEEVLIYLKDWQLWEGHCRTLMVAFLLWRDHQVEHMLKRLLPAMLFFCVLCCLISMVNLWLIIPTHIASAVGSYFWLRSHELRTLKEADAKALNLTRDINEARVFVEWHNRFYRVFGSTFRTRRLEALNQEAKRLELEVQSTT